MERKKEREVKLFREAYADYERQRQTDLQGFLDEDMKRCWVQVARVTAVDQIESRQIPGAYKVPCVLVSAAGEHFVVNKDIPMPVGSLAIVFHTGVYLHPIAAKCASNPAKIISRLTTTGHLKHMEFQQMLCPGLLVSMSWLWKVHGMEPEKIAEALTEYLPSVLVQIVLDYLVYVREGENLNVVFKASSLIPPRTITYQRWRERTELPRGI